MLHEQIPIHQQGHHREEVMVQEDGTQAAAGRRDGKKRCDRGREAEEEGRTEGTPEDQQDKT